MNAANRFIDPNYRGNSGEGKDQGEQGDGNRTNKIKGKKEKLLLIQVNR